MKKLLYALFALALLWSCQTIEEMQLPDHDKIITDNEVSGAKLPEILYASMSDEDKTPDTRTYVGGADMKDVLWHSGDAIAYICSYAFRAKYVFEGEDGASAAEFTLKENGDEIQGAVKPSVPYVVYPYSSEAYCKEVNDVNTLVVNYPSEQSYAPNSFGKEASLMVGTGETADATDFYFRNACGYLVIKLYNVESTLSPVGINIPLMSRCLQLQTDNVMSIVNDILTTCSIVLDLKTSDNNLLTC